MTPATYVFGGFSTVIFLVLMSQAWSHGLATSRKGDRLFPAPSPAWRPSSTPAAKTMLTRMDPAGWQNDPSLGAVIIAVDPVRGVSVVERASAGNDRSL